jgi:hypothetical protein
MTTQPDEYFDDADAAARCCICGAPLGHGVGLDSEACSDCERDDEELP